MSITSARSRRIPAAVAALAAALVAPLLAASPAGADSAGTASAGTDSGAVSGAVSGTAAVTLPPAHAGFDYQIGGAYTPPAGVTVVSRDRESAPAPGLYNICYVNAFQVQPDEIDEWDDDLLLRDANGDVIIDEDWEEAILDISTAAKRTRIAEKVNGWIDGCASSGFQAVEPDNYDSYDRSQGKFGTSAAMAFITQLSAHAHGKGLAIAQKNTADLAEYRSTTGLDFAVAEECGEWNECDTYTDAFGADVIVIEYTAKGLSTACAGWKDTLSIVRRDLNVVPLGGKGYLRQTC
ncbi:endo alpha-1,4 polygalactosaminidase [Streptomyces sp. NPDC093085]|uniref:endo alpha-1,4 polygalactosaminidase n=1 Tax=Streptomyces sp. NPDC093085 TaxID=3155068 RepID=UPI00341B03BF